MWAGNDNIGEVRYSYYNTYSYYYYLKDHLGDIRMVLNSSGGVDSYNDYYPFGMQMPGRNLSCSSDGRYKFSSKQLDGETSLYYFGASYYDAWSRQWCGVNPLANKYPRWSPYNYVEDDPITSVDPNGAQVKPKRLHVNLYGNLNLNRNLITHVQGKGATRSEIC